MLKSIEGNFNHPEVNELLTKHFIELRAASPEGSAHATCGGHAPKPRQADGNHALCLGPAVHSSPLRELQLL